MIFLFRLTYLIYLAQNEKYNQNEKYKTHFKTFPEKKKKKLGYETTTTRSCRMQNLLLKICQPSKI